MEVFLFVLIGIGLVLSVYGYVVERRVKGDVSYKPVCDINDHMSCTRAFRSPAGHLFGGLSNALAGIFFYLLLVFTVLLNMQQVTFLLSVFSVLLSVYLALVLIRQRNFCLVCVGVYIVNIAILLTILTM